MKKLQKLSGFNKKELMNFNELFNYRKKLKENFSDSKVFLEIDNLVTYGYLW
jgi:hypothetical protein